ncbi:MAG: DUF3467 domain-containing protein [Candidatus Moranbacteria bacterium]|jgi:hypothetical protein|nr:DUF3467 domain-containing protein [Candidatus Moranbacteria bacterium]MDD5652041.1 DUF3467 domain-containing protein [Candidatus Moranbacteria bacterium]MDX9855295.1 DUF3467 domain-containing protein [Candidatus Moranbacteria bacterium]
MNQSTNNAPKGGQQGQKINIKASDEKLGGTYSNMMQILHAKEEFVLDFLNVFPPTGTLNSRVIVSPGHFKRMVRAMEENLKKYEERFGSIEEASSPENAGIGFQERQ